MAPEKPRHLYRVTRRNKHRPAAIYWRSAPPGLAPAMRKADFLTPEIVDWALERNRRAAQIMAPPVPGTFHHLADLYRGSDERNIAPAQRWRELKPRTQADYRRYVEKLLQRFGRFQVADLDEEMVVELRDSLRATPRVANYMINVLSAMLVVALEHRSQFGLTHNPAANVKRLGRKAGVRPRQVYWTYADEQRFLADADETDAMVALGERLLAFTGQRPGDMRKMLLTDYDGEKIQVAQDKTGAKMWIPCHKALKPHLDHAKAVARDAGILNATFIRGKRGRAMGERYFATRWDRIAARTGTLHLNRQDLRRTACIRLSEAGCTVPQVASITGHSLRQAETILETYIARTYETAAGAIAKLEAHQERVRDGIR